MLQVLKVCMNCMRDRKYSCKRNPITAKFKDFNSGPGKHSSGNLEAWEYSQASMSTCSSLSACFCHLPDTGRWDLPGLFSA